MPYYTSRRPQPKSQQLSFSIVIENIPEYMPESANGTMLLEVPGQPRRAWIESDTDSVQVLISYALPANEQPLPMKLAVWNNARMLPLPANALMIQQSASIFLLSDQEFVLELADKEINYGELPKRGKHSVVRTCRLICQARLVEANGRLTIVYNSRLKADDPMEYCIVALPPTYNKLISGAVRIHDTVQGGKWHYYAVPVQSLW